LTPISHNIVSKNQFKKSFIERGGRANAGFPFRRAERRAFRVFRRRLRKSTENPIFPQVASRLPTTARSNGDVSRKVAEDSDLRILTLVGRRVFQSSASPVPERRSTTAFSEKFAENADSPEFAVRRRRGAEKTSANFSTLL